MITPDRILKISDFGVASELSQFSQSDICTHSFGSPAFQSPQIATGKKSFSGFKLDIWAAGVTLYVLVTGEYPFQGTNVFNLYEQIAKAEYDIPPWVEKPLAELIRGMMSRDEETRFTIKQIKENAWFQTTQYNDKPQPNPLVDRWRSISLLPYIAKAVNTHSLDMPYNRRMSTNPNHRLSAVHFSGFSYSSGNRFSAAYGSSPPQSAHNTVSSSSNNAVTDDEDHSDDESFDEKSSHSTHSHHADETSGSVSGSTNASRRTSLSSGLKEKVMKFTPDQINLANLTKEEKEKCIIL
jgi:serine/threonine protein kinase